MVNKKHKKDAYDSPDILPITFLTFYGVARPANPELAEWFAGFLSAPSRPLSKQAFLLVVLTAACTSLAVLMHHLT